MRIRSVPPDIDREARGVGGRDVLVVPAAERQKRCHSGCQEDAAAVRRCLLFLRAAASVAVPSETRLLNGRLHEAAPGSTDPSSEVVLFSIHKDCHPAMLPLS